VCPFTLVVRGPLGVDAPGGSRLSGREATGNGIRVAHRADSDYNSEYGRTHDSGRSWTVSTRARVNVNLELSRSGNGVRNGFRRPDGRGSGQFVGIRSRHALCGAQPSGGDAQALAAKRATALGFAFSGPQVIAAHNATGAASALAPPQGLSVRGEPGLVHYGPAGGGHPGPARGQPTGGRGAVPAFIYIAGGGRRTRYARSR
jgi:hypothetical protein